MECFAGLLLSGLALHMAAPAQRLVPEALTFASTLLATAVPQPATAGDHPQQWLLPSGTQYLPAPPSLSLVQILQSMPTNAAFATDGFRGSLLQSTVGIIGRAADVFALLTSFPELFASAIRSLRLLSSTMGLPEVSHGCMLVTWELCYVRRLLVCQERVCGTSLAAVSHVCSATCPKLQSTLRRAYATHHAI